MTKREALRQYTQQQTLQALGFTPTEAQALRPDQYDALTLGRE